MLKHNTAVTKEEEAVVIDMQEPVTLNFALRYLTLFTKVQSVANLFYDFSFFFLNLVSIPIHELHLGMKISLSSNSNF